MSTCSREIQNKTEIHVDDFEEYKKSTYPSLEENHNERRKKEKEMHLWNIFKQFPPPPQSGSTVEHKGYEVLIKFLKVCAYLILFSSILCFSVISKGTILFATSNINSHYVRFCDYNSDFQVSESNEYFSLLSEKGRIAWMWCIIMAFIIPEFLGIISAMKSCLFKRIKFDELPSIQNFLFSSFIEALHSAGMALLFLVCLPDLNVLQGASIMSCVCFIPSLLAFIASGTKYFHNRGLKSFLSVLADALAFALQTTGILASFFFTPRERSESIYILPVALILTSFRWWPNYVSTGKESVTWLSKIKTDLEPTRFCLQGVTAIIRIIVFIISAILINYCKISKFDLNQFFNGFWINNYTVDVVYFRESNIPEDVTSLVRNSDVQIHFLLIHAFSSFFAYEFGNFACKTLMHKFGFAFPLLLSVPTTIGFLLVAYGLRDKNTCAFHGIIPDYLFYDVPSLKSFEMLTSEWYIWLSIFWWISQIWITSHTWTSTCERLAKSERIFAILTYDSLVIDQCLSLNRRKETRSEYTTIPLKMNFNVKGNERLTIIKACATMWHETENEMNKLIGSILRLDKDNCAMRVVQEHFDVRIPDYFDLEVHVFFDDAFQCVHKCYGNCINENETQVNEYVIKFVKVMEQNLKKMKMQARPPEKYPTPFGGRLKWILPGGSNLIVHLKDKNKIRHRKRWSQVMYMYYLLGYNLMELPIDLEQKEKIAENTYILTLDGDIDFDPSAVKTLIDLMKRDESLGAACGRIHPIGNGPIVWFQKFEYAIGHWLQKSTEHIIGCVLCSPGCFSLFRAKALMDYNVMRKYATESTEARHYIQYDQGEDRWLCTLILQMGYRVEYSAASDAFTHAPENFNEFFVQRRRWIPSTMANIFDLLNTSEETRRCNNNISWLYMLYQWVLMGATIIGPGTIFLMLVGAFVSAFRIDNWSSLSYHLIPIAIFITACLICKESVQLKLAEVISAIYGLIMGTVLVGIMLQISEDGLLAPSTLLFFIITGQIIIAGLLHPKEWSCLICIIIYYITVPSMYMLLIIFALFNLHNISWGTRDIKSPSVANPETTDVQQEDPGQNGDEKKKDKYSRIKDLIDFSFDRLLKCCMYSGETKEEIKLNEVIHTLYRMEGRMKIIETKVGDNPPSIVECVNSVISEKECSFISTSLKSDKDSVTDIKSEQDTMHEKESSTYRPRMESNYEFEDSDTSNDESISGLGTNSESIQNETDFIVNPSWMFDTELGKGEVSYLVTEEETFWIDVIDAYLKPIPIDEETKKKNEKVAKDLKELRNKYVFQFLMINAFFIVIIFLMQLNKDKLHIVWPFGATYNITYNVNDPKVIHIEKYYLRLEPIGCVFIVTFFSILFIQFIAMLIHRFETFSHFLAKTNLDLYYCKKAVLPDEAIVIRYHDIFSKYVQKAYDNMIQDDGSKAMKPPGTRKTIPDLTERKESFVIENFNKLFHEYLDRTDLAEKSGTLNKPVIDAMRHRSTIHKTLKRQKNPSPIYESAYDIRNNLSKEESVIGKSGYDNNGFISD